MFRSVSFADVSFGIVSVSIRPSLLYREGFLPLCQRATGCNELGQATGCNELGQGGAPLDVYQWDERP